MTSIDIVGGGIAGLTLAAALGQCGGVGPAGSDAAWQVRVHDERDAVPPHGTALVLWPEALAALGHVGLGGLGRRIEAAGVPVERVVLHDARGRVLAAVHGPMTSVLRPDLARVLREALPPGARWSPAPLASVADVLALPGDLVVGADGVRSVVREAVAGPGAARRASGHVILRGVAPAPVESFTRQPAHAHEHWGAGWLVGLTPCAGGTNWFAALRADLPAGAGDQDVDAAAGLARLRRLVGDGPAAGLLEAVAAGEGSCIGHRAWRVPLRARWSRGRGVLLGDAAHGMAPNLGRGSAEAVLDAVSLARCLGAAAAGAAAAGRQPSRGELAAAVRRYVRVRRASVTPVAAVSNALMHVATAQRLATPRDALLRSPALAPLRR